MELISKAFPLMNGKPESKTFEVLGGKGIADWPCDACRLSEPACVKLILNTDGGGDRRDKTKLYFW